MLCRYKKIDPEEVKSEYLKMIAEWELGIRINEIVCEVLKKFEGKQITRRISNAIKKALEESELNFWYIHYDNDTWLGPSIRIVIKGKDNSASIQYGKFYLDKGFEKGEFNLEYFNSDNYMIRFPEWIDEYKEKMKKIDKIAEEWNSVIDEVEKVLPKLERFEAKFYCGR